TQGDDLRAPVSQITGVRIERLEVLDALVRVARRILTRCRHDQVGKEQRTQLIAGPDVDQPGADVGGLPGALRSVRRCDTARIPLRLRTDLIVGRWMDRPRTGAPPRVDADGVADLVHAGTRTVRAGHATAAIRTGDVRCTTSVPRPRNRGRGATSAGALGV